MSQFEERLEDLYATDARSWRVAGVGPVRRHHGWISGATLIAATVATSIAVILLVGGPTLERGQAGSQGAVPTASVAATGAVAAAGLPALTPDRRTLTQNGQAVLAIDNEQIVQWFRNESQLCDARNIGATADRRSFCTNVATFKDKTHFATAISSPDGMTVGFTIQSDTLSPDSVAGLFVRASGTVTFLTSYYIGNEFNSFSPSGSRFVYQGGCYEAKCALYVRDTATLAERFRINASTGGTDRTQSATFVRWVSDSRIEYRLGSELSTSSF